ncbi:16S rRNA (guanine(527)-N(7))-methyltransferase RsmG [Micromonospora sp. NBC_01412]|uniref:16S rRNA (guanine(527)-N(7))-methyltransferase RsmG n=1 Tax=Micromonospora sp. NBC_01412 TaxID=2903590 RepID=UPI00386DF603
MTHDDTTADAVTGPGGTPPGPSPVGSRRLVDGSDPAVGPDDTDGLELNEGSTAAVGPDGTDGPDPAVAALPPELAEAASSLFGERLDLAAAYAEVLATDGVLRGLIGPREAPRIWERHLLNCAAVAERIPEGASVLDVGSGAGLPGLVLAIARPDLTVTLVEPLARRTSFLVEVVERLGLTKTVRVFRGRADEAATGSNGVGPFSAEIVTARAVAPLDRLSAWCLPLVAPGGRLLAMKGSSAGDEIAEHAGAVAKLGGGEPKVHHCGVGVIEPPATVVEIVRERVVNPPRVKPASKRTRGGRRRGR